ncbi:unnamed protein product [Rodentolepis nana]|uniref:Uncharacterized protein n=1 Tax=Rodentolepis nana TaxID=102285 RepID=A0A0R3TUB1_RODNA|nr:unnamed protein product [Rodentolepis nana]
MKSNSIPVANVTWDDISSQIKKNVFEQKSILAQFPLEAAVISAREIVLSLAADCSCKKDAENALVQATAEAASLAQTSQKRAPGRHAGNSFGDVIRSGSGSGGGSRLSISEVEARSKGFSVKLDSEADLQWVMQAINYGLTMPPENWEIVAHSVHIYCLWLGCLLPAPVYSHGQKGVQQPLPHALLVNPLSYAPRLLFALCRFFTPRNVFKTADAADLTDTFFGLLHQSPQAPPDPVCTAAIKDIVKGIVPEGTQQISTGTGPAVAGEPERWLQKKYIPLVSCIVNRIEQILNTSHLLTGTLWDRLLEFSLAVGFAVLSIPPQIESSAITTSRPFSQVGLELF